MGNQIAIPREAADPTNLQVTRGNTASAEEQVLYIYSNLSIYENAQNETVDDYDYATSITS